MANEYASLSELKDSLGIEDTARDTILQRKLSAASRAIDRTTGRRFWLDDEPTARVLHPAGRMVSDEWGELLLVPDIGTADGLVVETGSGGAWGEVLGYETTPDDALTKGGPITGLRLTSWPWARSPGSRVRVTARWGWPAVPDEVAEATLLQAARLYKRKDSPEGVLGSAEWGVVRLSRIDPDVEALISHLILPGLG